MDLFFEGNKGVLKFSGRRTATDVFFIKEISGLGMPTKFCRITNFANQPGQELVLQKDEARTITLSVDAQIPKMQRRALKHVAEILYHPGTLIIHSGGEQRKIACRCTAFEEEVRHGDSVLSFVLQFVCDKPYFTEEKPRQVELLYRKDLIGSSFVLPCVFTERENKCTIVNQGDVPAEPILTIRGVTASVEGTGMTVINYTTGTQLVLETSVALGEIITIHIPERTVTSSVSGDIITALSPDSYLADFCLAEGANLLEVVSYDTQQRLSVTVTYDNQYIESLF